MPDRLTSFDPEFVGEYRLLSRLGAGGMGVVYLASSPNGSRVAVKVMTDPNRMTPELRSRLAREARALEVLDSPHVVRVLEVDPEAESPHLVMAYAEGESLDRAIPEGGLSAQDVRRFGSQLAGALAQARSHGIVHRDLKPNNVILGPEGICLVDFGIASLDEEGTTALTRNGGFLGSLAWLAPEVVAGGRADQRSDVFGLGLVLGYMALGRHPYGAGRPDAVMYRIMHEQPDLNGCPMELEGPIRDALSHDPGDRPTAEEVANALLTPGTPAKALTSRRKAGRGVQWSLAGVAAATLAAAVALTSTTGGASSATSSEVPDQAPGGPPATAEVTPPAPTATTPESGPFSSTCSWTQRDWVMGITGTCDGAGDVALSHTFDDDSKVTNLYGEIGGRTVSLEMPPPDGYDGPFVWDGTIDGVPVRILVEGSGSQYFVSGGSYIGDGSITATGPTAAENPYAEVPEDYYIFDNPSTVTGTYSGDVRVTLAQTAALCNVLTAAAPAVAAYTWD